VASVRELIEKVYAGARRIHLVYFVTCCNGRLPERECVACADASTLPIGSPPSYAPGAAAIMRSRSRTPTPKTACRPHHAGGNGFLISI
jgi:hypothetical protein